MVKIMSVTGDILTADYLEIDRLTIGDVGFSHVPIAFANVTPFKRFDLLDEPALLLGMDTLRLFRNVDIDFTNREIRFTVPRRSEEHTSELQSLMRNSYAVFGLQKKTNELTTTNKYNTYQ